MTDPKHYVLWLSGVMDLIGERAPTEAEWSMIKDKHHEALAQMTAERLLRPGPSVSVSANTNPTYPTSIIGSAQSADKHALLTAYDKAMGMRK